MQIVTRRVNEGLVIDETIQVTVLEIHDDHVRLAFSCPGQTPSYWEEVLYVEQSAAEDLAAATHELQLHH